jgi:1-acyl-sn-glycerol-3-phosphate acyltransferase
MSRNELTTDSAIRRVNASGLFWALAAPATIEAIESHNRTVGTRVQRFTQALVKVFLLGPIFFACLRALLRVRVVNARRLSSIIPQRKVIYACRHFYEWDPFIMFYGAGWTRALRAPWLDPVVFAGHFWMKTRLRRLVSWLLGLIGVIRNQGLGQYGLERVSELLGSPRPMAVAVCPTGPIGRSECYEVKPGIAQLALANPEVTIQPITFVGIQHLRFRSLWRLRRPPVTIAFCEPFRAADVKGATPEERIHGICAEIARRWTDEELRLGAAAPVVTLPQAAGPLADEPVRAAPAPVREREHEGAVP